MVPAGPLGTFLANGSPNHLMVSTTNPVVHRKAGKGTAPLWVAACCMPGLLAAHSHHGAWQPTASDPSL